MVRQCYRICDVISVLYLCYICVVISVLFYATVSVYTTAITSNLLAIQYSINYPITHSHQQNHDELN